MYSFRPNLLNHVKDAPKHHRQFMKFTMAILIIPLEIVGFPLEIDEVATELWRDRDHLPTSPGSTTHPSLTSSTTSLFI